MGDARRDSDEPIIVTQIAPMSGTGDGRALPQRTEAVTPDHLPNVIVQVVTPLWVIFIRSAKVYVITLVGLVSAGLVHPNTIPASDFFDLVAKCAGLSVSGACVAALTNLGELLSRLDQRWPSLTA